MDLFQHPSPFLKPISTLGVFALGALLSGLYREQRYINLEIRYERCRLCVLVVPGLDRGTLSKCIQHPDNRCFTHQGPSIKYVTLVFTNFPPALLSHFVTHLGTPLKYVTHLGPPRFLVVQKARSKAPCIKSLSMVC